MTSSRGHIIEPKNEVPRLVVWAFALAGLVAAVTLITIFAPRLIDTFSEQELANDNRTWLTREWTQSARSDENLLNTIAIMEDNAIEAIYLQTHSWHGQTGEFVELPYSQSFVQQFRANSRIQIFDWLIVEPDKLFDAGARQQVIDAAQRAIQEQGFDGIHLQVRSVPDNSQDFVDLLRGVRGAIGPQAIISITVPPDRRPADPSVPAGPDVAAELTWSQEYKRRVVLNVNEVVLMGHASGLENAAAYESWLAYQYAAYADLLQEFDFEIAYIVALPTYEAELGHDPDVENVETAIAGIFAGMNRAHSGGSQINGVGLYPWEQTAAPELETYWQLWVNRSQ